jgi:hypothetical protein
MSFIGRRADGFLRTAGKLRSYRRGNERARSALRQAVELHRYIACAFLQRRGGSAGLVLRLRRTDRKACDPGSLSPRLCGNAVIRTRAVPGSSKVPCSVVGASQEDPNRVLAARTTNRSGPVTRHPSYRVPLTARSYLVSGHLRRICRESEASIGSSMRPIVVAWTSAATSWPVRESAFGPQRRFVAVQQNARNAGRSRRSPEVVGGRLCFSIHINRSWNFDLGQCRKMRNEVD